MCVCEYAVNHIHLGLWLFYCLEKASALKIARTPYARVVFCSLLLCMVLTPRNAAELILFAGRCVCTCVWELGARRGFGEMIARA